MTQRQAKKVLRKSNGYRAICFYRASTRWKAALKNDRTRFRCREVIGHDGLRRTCLTPGWRWGRWDPQESRPPWEAPF